MSRKKEQKRLDAFLADLTGLAYKHKITIFGCGCCGSPMVELRDEVREGGHYVTNEYSFGDDLEFYYEEDN